jgi:uncharacterized protein YaaN involved in tellurite resistance
MGAMDETSVQVAVSYEKLTEAQKAKVEEIGKQIDFASPNAVTRYGVGIQGRISETADRVLSEVRARDTGHIGKILADLLNRIREMRIESLPGRSGGFLSRIPLMGAVADGARRFMTRYQSVSTQVVRIADELEKARVRLLRDVEALDGFYDGNMDYFRDIGLYILAGEMRLKELRESVLPASAARAANEGDPLEVQKHKDLVQAADRLERKLHDLRISRTISLQTGPQIRLVQNGNRELAEKIQSSILNTIPLWKHQMALAINLIRQSQVLGLQKEISTATKELLEKNAEMLKAGSVEIAKEAEKGIVDVETLKKVNASLIATIEETIKLQQEGRARREQARLEMERLEKELKDKLMEARSGRA